MVKRHILYLLFTVAACIVPAASYAMEEQATDEPRTAEQPQLQDDTVITVQLEDENGQPLFSIELPYKTVQLSNTLLHNFSFDDNTQNKTISIAIHKTGLELSIFKGALEILKSVASEKCKEEHLSRILTKKTLLQLLTIADYLDCQSLHTTLADALHKKLHTLLLEKKKFPHKNSDKYNQLFDFLCSNVKNKVQIQRTEQHIPFGLHTSQLLFSPHGKLLTSIVASTAEAWTWDVTTLKRIPFLQSLCSINHICYTPDETIAAFGDIRDIKIRNIVKNERRKLSYPSQIVSALALSPHGTLLASGDSGGSSIGMRYRIHLWDVLSGTQLRSLGTPHIHEISSLCFSPDGTLLASSSADDQRIVIWDTKTWRQIKSLPTTRKPITLRFAPDSKTFAFNTSDAIHIIDSLTGTCLHTLTGHKKTIHSFCFSPDESNLVSTAGDTTIKIWNLTTGDCLKTLVIPQDYEVSAVHYSSSIKVAVAQDKEITIYTFHDIEQEFTLETLSLLDYLLLQKNQETPQQLPSEPFYFNLYSQLPEDFQVMFKDAFKDVWKARRKCVIS